MITDLNRLADVTQRIADSGQKMPGDIAKERDATINRLLGRISVEREDATD